MSQINASFREKINELTAFSGAFDETNDAILIYDYSDKKLKKLPVSRLSAEDGNGDQTVTRDLAVVRNASVGNTLSVGASGAAGTFQIFPTTAAKGKTTLTMADNTGDTTTAIAVAAQAAARTYTIADIGASTAAFAMFAAAPTAAIGATPAEIDRQCDISLQTETIAEGGAVSVTKRITKIVSTGAGAITLAAPDASSLGQVKVIEMTGGEHDVTLALTNVEGQSSGTTATFSDIGDSLVLVAGTLKWKVCSEAGIALS